MDLKNQIRKCKFTPKKDIKRSKTERKIINLKLKDEPTQQDEVENSKKSEEMKESQASK